MPTPPYPQIPPAAYYSYSPPAQTNYLSAPLQPIRSHSQPARVRFADQDSDRSTELGETDSSDDSTDRRRERRTHHQHHHQRPHRSHDRTRDSDRDSNYSDRDRERERRHHKHRPRESKLQEKEHKTRDTFLGAGAGTILGDAIFPGLGTAAGLLLGGYSGRKYAERSLSEDGGRGCGRREEGRRERERGERRRKDSFEESDSGSDYGRRRGGRR